MRKLNFTRKLLAFLVACCSVTIASAQVTTNSGSGLAASYPSLNAAITALNGATISSPVIITLTANETAPAGGYVITASGTSTNTIILSGGNNTVTASAGHVTGSTVDAIFKITGGDYITIQNFTLTENSANTVTTLATNTMTEFGIALFYGSATDGAQNNTLRSNNISLSSSYQNAIGIYSNTTHTATTPGTAANATASTGLNSNLKIYSNAISNAAYGISIITPANTATVTESGLDIGGTSAATGNTITYGFNTVADGGWNAFSNASVGINFRNGVAANIQYNTVTSNNMTIATNGIMISSGTTPSGVTYTNTISNNIVTVNQTGTTAATGIDFGYGISTGTITSASNTVTINQTISAASSAAITAIKANYTAAVNTQNANNITINQSTSSGALSSTTIGINITGAATTVNATGNVIDIKQASGAGTYTGTVTYLDVNATSLTINVTGNQLKTTGSTIRSTGTMTGIKADSYTTGTFYNFKNNTGNIDRVAASGTMYFTYSSTSPSEAADSISQNNITFTNVSGTSAAYGIFSNGGASSTGCVKSFANNIINISGSNTGTTKGIVSGYSFGNITGNAITINNASTTLIGIDGNQSGVGAYNITNNVLNLNSSSTSTVAVTGILEGSSATGPFQIFNNTLTNISANGGGAAIPTVTGIISGVAPSPGTNIYNNTFTNISAAGTAPTGIITVNGINVTAGTLTNVYSNTITNLQAGATSANAIVNGIVSSGGTTTNIYRNKVYDLVAAGTGTGTTITGILMSSGTTVNVYNNLIGQTNALTGVNSTDGVRGISITATGSSTSYNVYYNTVYLNTSSTGANFGSTGIYHTGNATATTAKLDLRNNIIINLSAYNGTGLTTAFRRSSTALGNYATTSNRNLLHAGTPGASNLLLSDGTNTYQTIAAYQAAVSTRDANSFTGEAAFTYPTAGSFFISLSGTNANFLKPVTGITTQVESGAAPITGFTDDYNAVTRPASGTSPDLGAWEFAGTTPAPVITFNTLTPNTTAQCSATARTVSVSVTTAGGTITGAVLNYSLNGGAPNSVTMSNTSGAIWTGTIPAATPTNASVTWTVTATNSLGLSTTYTGAGYADDPLNGSTAVATVTRSSVCSGSGDTLTAAMIKAGTGNISTATTTELGGGVYRNGYGTGDFRHQLLYTAAEMTAAGFTAGNITDLTFNVTSVGSGSANNYTIKMANVPATVLNGTFQTASFTQVYLATTYTAISGNNTHTFTTPFYWNGTSNILIDICYNISTTNSSSTLSASTPSAISNTNLLGVTGACTAASGASTYANRPVIAFSGNKAPAATSFSWSDGAAVIGTTSPLVITPTATKTYTATLTAAGCPITTNGVTVTVLPLPTSPVATNSTQCGVGVPTASVSGATTGQTYNWYNAANGGTLLQTGGSTYTTAISATTTFYVAINNGTCESIRTPVTVTVNAPDAVTATASTTTPCANNTMTLTATKAPGSNTYTYTWTANPATGSGIATSVSGANPSITPTLPGTYVYTVAANSATCNTTATVTVTVKPSPSGITATASQNALCLGGSFNLTSAITGSTTLLSENFNGTTNTWTKTNTSGGSGAASVDWTLRADGYSYGSTPVVFHSNDNSQFYQSNADAGGSGTAANTTLQSPAFSTMGYDSVTLKFYHYFKYYSSAASDSATVEVSTNGTTWTPVQTFKGADAGGPAAFASASVNLNSYANQPSLYVRFHYTSGWGYYWNIDNVTVNGGGGTWAWTSTPAGFTSAVRNPSNVTPSSAGSYTYTATLTNSVGCSSSATTTAVVINPTPAITFTPAVAKICAGSDVSITASGATTYSWSPATGLSATTGATVIASPATTTTYTITGTANGCTGTATKTVTVNPLPVITISPSTTTTICAGNSVTLTASGAATYIWLPPNGLNTTTGSTVIASPTVTTLYNIGGTDSNGCTATATKTINVSLPPVVTVSPTTATSICAGSSVSLTANGAATYKWSPATGLSDTVGATVIASPATTTTYTITGDDGIGCTTTVTKTITVNTLPSVSISPATTSTICAGNSVTLTASGAATYSWSPATGLSTTTGATTIASPTVTTTYTVTGTNGNGCSNTATKTVNVNAVPVMSISPATAGICTGGNVTLTANGANTYSWSPATGLNTTTGATVIASPTTTTTYTVTGTGANGCTATITRQVVVTPIPVVTVSPATATAICNGSSVTLTGNGATTYSWSPATGLSATTGTSVIASPTTTITYTVTGTTNGCSSTATKLVTVNPLPTAAITAAGTTNFCQGGAVTLNANTGTGLSYTWRRNGGAIGVTTASYTATTTGSYDVIVSNGTCSATSNAISVIVSTPPTPVILASGPTTVCQGNNVTLSVDPNAAYTYQWQRGGVNIAGANNSTYLASISGDYTIVVTNGTCVVTSQPMTVTVNALPPAIVLPQGPTTFCQGGAVTMFASIAAGYTYQWYINGNIIPGANNATYVATASGDYAVDVADGNCSASAQPVTITVNPLPAQPVIIVTNGTTMTTGQFITYQWYLNGVAIPGATNQTYNAVANGNYTVVVTNFAGCEATSEAKTISSVGVVTYQKEAVTVYPNPASHMIHIAADKVVNVSIRAVDGKEVIRKDNAVDVDIQNLADGIYLIRISDKNGLLIKTERLVKTNK